jgi:hypothetical protein
MQQIDISEHTHKTSVQFVDTHKHLIYYGLTSLRATSRECNDHLGCYSAPEQITPYAECSFDNDACFHCADSGESTMAFTYAALFFAVCLASLSVIRLLPVHMHMQIVHIMEYESLYSYAYGVYGVKVQKGSQGVQGVQGVMALMYDMYAHYAYYAVSSMGFLACITGIVALRAFSPCLNAITKSNITQFEGNTGSYGSYTYSTGVCTYLVILASVLSFAAAVCNALAPPTPTSTSTSTSTSSYASASASTYVYSYGSYARDMHAMSQAEADVKAAKLSLV